MHFVVTRLFGNRCWLGADGGLDVVEEMCKNALKVEYCAICGILRVDPELTTSRSAIGTLTL